MPTFVQPVKLPNEGKTFKAMQIILKRNSFPPIF